MAICPRVVARWSRGLITDGVETVPTMIRQGPVPGFSEINPPRAMTARAPKADTGRALPVMAGASPASGAAFPAAGGLFPARCKSVPADATRSFPGAGSLPTGAGPIPARCKSTPAMAGRSFSGAGSIPAPCKSGAARAGNVLPLAGLIPAPDAISSAGEGMIPAITGPARKSLRVSRLNTQWWFFAVFGGVKASASLVAWKRNSKFKAQNLPCHPQGPKRVRFVPLSLFLLLNFEL